MTAEIDARATGAASELLRGYYNENARGDPVADALSLARRLKAGRPWLSLDDVFGQATGIFQRALIDVDRLIELHCQVKLRIENLSNLDTEAGSEVYGVADTVERSITICERTLNYEPLFRTTALHELGHIRLHSVGTPMTSLAYAPDSRKRSKVEREADAFMAAIALPPPLLALSVMLSARFHEVPVYEPFLFANDEKHRWQWRKYYIPDLIDRMRVSKHLILVALSRFGLINFQTYCALLETGTWNRYLV